MTPVVALLLAATPCELPPDAQLSPRQRSAICELNRTPPVPAPRGSLDEIYRRQGFEQARAPEDGATMKRLRAWLESLFQTAGAETYSNLTRLAVLVLAAVLVLWAVIALGRRRRRTAHLEASGATEPPSELGDPRGHLARAEALVTTDPRAAAREGLLAVLSALERARLARPDRVKTNREIAQELPERGAPAPLVESISSLLVTYDEAWYSQRPLAEESARSFVADAARLVARVNAPSVARP